MIIMMIIVMIIIIMRNIILTIYTRIITYDNFHGSNSIDINRII